MKHIEPITEGRMSKGGQNHPNLSEARPPAPGGSGGNGEVLLVHRPGAEVLLWGEIQAKVLQVCITESRHVTYQLSWFDDRNRVAQWVERHEVESPNQLPTMPIGFHH